MGESGFILLSSFILVSFHHIDLFMERRGTSLTNCSSSDS